MNIKITKAKVLRFLGITKTIPLDKYEIQWIKLCKGHYDQKYNFEDENRIERLKPLFTEIYTIMYPLLLHYYESYYTDQQGQFIGQK